MQEIKTNPTVRHTTPLQLLAAFAATVAVLFVLLLGAGFLTGRDIRQEVRVKKTTSPFCPSVPV